MARRNKKAPGRPPRGCKNSNSHVRNDPSTERSRLPSNWRSRIPDARLIYLRILKDWNEKADGYGTARCPFHHGALMSLKVDLLGTKHCWKCTDCDRAGDLVALIMKLHQSSFLAAVHWLMAWRAPRGHAAAHEIAACRVLLREAP